MIHKNFVFDVFTVNIKTAYASIILDLKHVSKNQKYPTILLSKMQVLKCSVFLILRPCALDISLAVIGFILADNSCNTQNTSRLCKKDLINCKFANKIFRLISVCYDVLTINLNQKIIYYTIITSFRIFRFKRSEILLFEMFHIISLPHTRILWSVVFYTWNLILKLCCSNPSELQSLSWQLEECTWLASI